MRLAQSCGLPALAYENVRIGRPCGASPHLKIPAIVAGMAAGADSIDDLELLRHGAMGDLFAGIRAPSTLGSFLRSFDFGNVRQLQKVSRLLLAELAASAPLLRDAGVLAFIDVDSARRRVYGYSRQGAAFGHAKIASKSLTVRGLNALAATVTTPLSAPVIAATRLRGGNADTARGAASLIAEATGASKEAGCTGIIVVRMDSGCYSAAACRAARRGGAYFSVTAKMDPRSGPRSPRSPGTPGSPSATRRPSGMSRTSGWSPTPGSPRPAAPRLPRGKARPSPRG
jgi:hypothetical protein